MIYKNDKNVAVKCCKLLSIIYGVNVDPAWVMEYINDNLHVFNSGNYRIETIACLFYIEYFAK